MNNLVLLPGMDGTGELFHDFVETLPRKFNIQVVRYPTNNFLSYQELTAFLQARSSTSDPFALIAESFSTPLAIHYAATAPPNLKGVVLCAGFVVRPAPSWLRLIGDLLASLPGKRSAPDFLIRQLLAGPGAPSSLVAAVRSAISQVEPRVLGARIQAVLACDARQDLKQVSVPILYLQASEDCLVRASSFRKIQQINPDVSLATVPGPHLLFQRESKATSALVSEFVSQLEQERT